MRKTMGGIAAVVASLWAGCSSGGPEELGFQEIFVKTHNPNDSEFQFDKLIGRMAGGNDFGVGCPTYGSMLEARRYDVPLTKSDIDTTGGNHLKILEMSTNRILKYRGLNGGPKTEEARRNIEFFLPIQNPRFYDHHQFKSGERVRYVVFHSDGVGGTLNCTL